MAPTVRRISIAPVKSLGLVHPEHVDLELRGVRGDRRFWLVDADGRLFNNKRNGPLVTIRPEWDEETRRLALTFPDGETVEGVVELGASVPAILYREPHPSRHVLGPWQEAISEFAGQPLRLLWSENLALDRGGDVGGVSLVSRGSLERLRERAGSSTPIDGRRFRMLFEIDGVGPHAEDEWIGRSIRIGAAVIGVRGDVGRCAVTTHDPDTGIRNLDTLAVLADYRPDGVSEPLPFGVYGSVETPGRVRVGDAVVAPGV